MLPGRMNGYIAWNVNPEIIEGLLPFRWYGVCWMLGMIVAYRIMRHVYRSEGLSQNELDNLTIYAVTGAVLGARLGHILFYDPVYYWNHPIEILPIKLEPSFQFTGFTGLASHGGVLGTLFALYLYNRKFKTGYLWLLDRLTIAGAALGCFIRLGNLMNSEIIGIPSKVPWAFIFQRVDVTPRHPAQLYEAVCYLVIAVVLYVAWRSGRFQERTGFISGLGISLIFVQRFVMEFLKENQVAFEDELMLNVGQMLSIPLIVVGAALMSRKFKV